MRDLGFVGFLGLLLIFGMRRPFLAVLGYVYVDIVAPQRLSYYLLNSVPLSLIFFAVALIGWMAVDDKRDTRLSPRQFLLICLLGYAACTTLDADFPIEAAEKWGWVWKSLVFAIFLPFTLRTRLRIEALLLFMILSASSIIVVGGIKTMFSGGGYGSLNLMVDNNSGLYEGSTISAVAIAIIPTILWLAKYGTVFRPGWTTRGYACALVFACLLIPIGTETRTGLICILLVALMMLRDSRRRMLYIGFVAVAALVAAPMLPKSFTERMGTIQNYQGDASASTRLAVWQWTWGYAKEHPLGGGFNAYLQNKVTIDLKSIRTSGDTQAVTDTTQQDAGRAYHSAYFEMLGEQGFPGLAMWLALMLGGIWRMEVLRRRFRQAPPAQAWIAPLATALQHGQIIYMVGAAFVAIAFQPFIYMLLAAQIGLDGYCARTFRRERAPMIVRRPAPAAA